MKNVEYIMKMIFGDYTIKCLPAAWNPFSSGPGTSEYIQIVIRYEICHISGEHFKIIRNNIFYEKLRNDIFPLSSAMWSKIEASINIK